jgi:protein-tyrosine phosphatase
MRHLVDEAGLADTIEVDGAGTGAWHIGEPPDERATAAAARRGIALTGVARQITPNDFYDFDLILAVDAENLHRLRRVAPPEARGKVRLFDTVDVPDPYYGGADGFDDALDQITKACEHLLDELRQD